MLNIVVRGDSEPIPIRDRRYNLLFYGATDIERPVVEVVREFLVSDFKMSREEADSVFIVNAHRLPRRQMRGPTGLDPIIVKFGSMGDRDFILEAARRRGFMKDRKPDMVYTDLPADMKRERGRLAQETRKLRREGKKKHINVVSTDLMYSCSTKIKIHQDRGYPSSAITRIQISKLLPRELTLPSTNIKHRNY